QVQLVK
nr:Chain B, Nanobody 5344N74D [Lama glama]